MSQRDLIACLSVATFMIVSAACPQSASGSSIVSGDGVIKLVDEPSNTSDLDAPWPTLPDGRLVLDIFKRRIAISSCNTCRRDINFKINRYQKDTVFLDWGIIVDHPDQLRKVLIDADHVTIETGNQKELAGLLFGRFVRNTKPFSHVLSFTIYRKQLDYSYCKRDYSTSMTPLCQLLLDLENDSKDADFAGFALNKGHFNGGGKDDTLYVSTETAQRSAVGLPSYFICDWSSTCSSALNPREGPGYLIAPDVGIAFSFEKKDYPETRWLDLQRQWIGVFADMIVP